MLSRTLPLPYELRLYIYEIYKHEINIEFNTRRITILRQGIESDWLNFINDMALVSHPRKARIYISYESDFGSVDSDFGSVIGDFD